MGEKSKMNDRSKRNVHPFSSDNSTYSVSVCKGIDFSISCCKHELSIFVPALIGLIYSDSGTKIAPVAKLLQR